MVSNVKPLLEKYHVAAYYCGHDHDMQLLNGKKRVKEEERSICVMKGTLRRTSGSREEEIERMSEEEKKKIETRDTLLTLCLFLPRRLWC